MKNLHLRLKFLTVAAGLLILPNFAVAEISIEDTVANSSLAGSFLAARVAVRDNDDEAAVAFYKRAQALDPDDKNLKQNLFVSLLANGQIDDALEMAGAINGSNNAGNMAKIVLATEALRKRSWLKVPQHLEDVKGADLDTLIKDIFNAWASFGAGEFDAAIKITDEVSGPDWVNLVRDYHVALMAAAAGKNEIANSKFKAVIERRQLAGILTETYVRAIEAHAIAYARDGKIKEAKDVIANGFTLLPSHEGFEKIDDALDTEKPLAPLVSSAQEGVAELFFNIASAIGTDNGTSFAKTYFQFADYLNGNSDVIAYGLGGVFEKQKNYAQANELLLKIPETSPLFRRASTAIALNLNREDKTDEAVSKLRELIAKNPKNLNTYMTLGALFSGKERYDDAAKVYDSAVKMIGVPEKFHWNLFYRRGISRERLKQWELAEPNFKLALELRPDQPDVLNYLGYSWIDMGLNLDEGLEMIRKAVRQDPKSGYIIDSLGWAQYKLGNFDEAVKELEKAIAIMPYDATINDHLGDAYWKVGRKLEALFQWKHALNAKPDDGQKKNIEAKLKNGLTEKTESVSQSSN